MNIYEESKKKLKQMYKEDKIDETNLELVKAYLESKLIYLIYGGTK